MRNNQPVTQRDYQFPDSMTLMSSTDTQSHITYANDAFVEVSGFSREEIIGQPHNLVRHPDMPTQAFADMWQTLKDGQAWTALVKDRRKNGDHYWVRANATPTKLVDQAGATMGEVVSSIRRVTDIMGEITAASSEQSAGVAQMGEAIMQMDQATQQNAALVEQSAAAAGSLQQQAKALVHVIAAFRVDKGDQPTPAAAPVARRPEPKKSFPSVDRRGANRSRNVTRLTPRPEPEPVELGIPIATRRSDAAGGWAPF